MTIRSRIYCVSCALLLQGICAFSQDRKQVNNNVHSWLGLFNTFRIGEHWGLVGDVLLRRNEFVQTPGFYWVRLGGGYWFNNNVSLIGAYSNQWLYQPRLSNASFTYEQRFDQQFSVTTRAGKVSLLNRLRAEARWRKLVENNAVTDAHYFTERVRYLFSAGIPLSTKPFVPSLTLSSELLLQFGRQVVVNPLDQARVFTGIRQQMGNGWSFDFGYMLIYQQTAAGNVYNLNHTIRLLFYYVKPSSHTLAKDLQPSEDE